MQTIRLKTDKLIFGGQALGRAAGKTCFLWNALAGEEVTARITGEKSGTLEGVAIEIHQASPERIAPREAHFLACSPWQILDWEAENRWKAEIALETFKRIGRLADLDLPSVFAGEKIFGYRNKLEYQWLELRGPEGPQLHFGIHQRESHDHVPVERCDLACAEIHEAASDFLEWLKAARVPAQALDKLILRSNGEGRTLSTLSVRPAFDLKKLSLPPLREGQILEIETAAAEKKNRAPETVWRSSEGILTTQVLGVPIQSGPRSFFQINLPVFEQALRDMAGFLSPHDRLFDFYAGAGAVSLPLAGRFREAVLVESHPEAAHFARRNIKALNLTHCRVEAGRAENFARGIEPFHVVLLDPPRAGLETAFTKRLLEKKPQRLLYLSCNAATQARDISRLSGAYALKFLKVYNFFPRTPHFETLAVLDRKSLTPE